MPSLRKKGNHRRRKLLVLPPLPDLLLLRLQPKLPVSEHPELERLVVTQLELQHLQSPNCLPLNQPVKMEKQNSQLDLPAGSTKLGQLLVPFQADRELRNQMLPKMERKKKEKLLIPRRQKLEWAQGEVHPENPLKCNSNEEEIHLHPEIVRSSV